MALHNIKIVVVDGGRAGSYKARSTGTGGEKKKDYKDSLLYKMLNLKDTIKEKVQSGMTPAGVFAMNMGVRVGVQTIKTFANYYLSDIGRKNGDDSYQASINRQIESVTDPLSIAGGTLSGAATGSMFGPIGAGIGAIAGLISSSVSLGFKYAERERAYQHTLFEENNNQAYKLSRANYSIYTGRLR